MATFDFKDLAYDESTGFMYVVGGTATGDAIIVRIADNAATDITATVLDTVPSSILYAVRVLEPDHIAVAGENGFFAEQVKASASDTFWPTKTVGGNNTIVALGGDTYSTLALSATSGTSGTLYIRGILTDMQWKAADTLSGFTVNAAAVDMATGITDFGVNDAVLLTATETLVVKSCVPDS
jgi:hypothetical protein